ncbi:TetR family transcriptional regulator [Kineosporia mesophila]|uniref:TetR family transcriptional regulator n=1 Tax=Kineosporia mesophila TaxID=566012 RepID=A0ABP6Z4L9_9ACTN|nr:TetR family transcriptional regulator [Kineosporia mesophila]
MVYDSAATKQRILDAATQEFATYGIAGARVDRIAERAPANKASIYSYFGNKQDLFAAVLQRTLTRLAEAVAIDPDRVPDYVGELFDYQLSHPELIRLVQQEALALEPEEALQRESRAAHYDDKVSAVRTAQKAGTVGTDLDARNIVLALIGMVSWFTAAPQISQMIVGDVTSTRVLRKHRAALIECARRIVSPVGS